MLRTLGPLNHDGSSESSHSTLISTIQIVSFEMKSAFLYLCQFLRPFVNRGCTQSYPGNISTKYTGHWIDLNISLKSTNIYKLFWMTGICHKSRLFQWLCQWEKTTNSSETWILFFPCEKQIDISQCIINNNLGLSSKSELCVKVIGGTCTLFLDQWSLPLLEFNFTLIIRLLPTNVL